MFSIKLLLLLVAVHRGFYLGSFTDLQCNIQSCFVSVVVHLMCKAFFSV